MTSTTSSPPGGDVQAAQAGGRRLADSVTLDSRQGEALVRLVECAPEVRRRHQFFMWSQSQLFPLLPHQVLVCGAYNRRRRAVTFEVFHSIVLSPPALQALTDASGPLLSAATAAWVRTRGQPLLVELAQLGSGAALSGAASLLVEHRLTPWLLHGVTRPQRPAEIESLFVFAGLSADTEQSQRHLELMLPHLHSTWQRVQAHEIDRELPAADNPPRRQPTALAQQITDRERQILMWVRDGKTNPEIGVVLGISPLTVKNHVQKILRKMGANNRAHAVAQALALNLLDPA